MTATDQIIKILKGAGWKEQLTRNFVSEPYLIWCEPGGYMYSYTTASAIKKMLSRS